MTGRHNIAVALALSGLVHGLFLLAVNFKQVNIQSPQPRMDVLYLELAMSTGVVVAKPEQDVAESNSVSLIARQDEVAEQSHERDVQEKQTVAQVSAGIMKDSFEDHFESLQQASKPVENHDQFIQLVYQAVNQHKRYPYMARRMGQEGKVKISFVMHPDGKVTDIMLVESSRYSLLDRAAEESIAAISPFVQAADYLAYEKMFDIAVEFRIN